MMDVPFMLGNASVDNNALLIKSPAPRVVHSPKVTDGINAENPRIIAPTVLSHNTELTKSIEQEIFQSYDEFIASLTIPLPSPPIKKTIIQHTILTQEILLILNSPQLSRISQIMTHVHQPYAKCLEKLLEKLDKHEEYETEAETFMRVFSKLNGQHNSLRAALQKIGTILPFIVQAKFQAITSSVK